MKTLNQSMQFFGIRDLRENIGAYTRSAESGGISIISRNGTPLTVNIPFDEELIALGAHKTLAIKLFQEQVLSLKKAARYAGMKTDEFIQLLGAMGVSVLGDPSELQQDLEQF